VQKYLLELQDSEKAGKPPGDPTTESLAVEVNQEDFEGAIAALIPSVSESELAHYRQVQKQFNDSSKQEAETKGKGKGKAKAKAKGKREGEGGEGEKERV